VALYVTGQTDHILFRDDEWNLDTGRNELALQGKLVFWEVA